MNKKDLLYEMSAKSGLSRKNVGEALTAFDGSEQIERYLGPRGDKTSSGWYSLSWR